MLHELVDNICKDEEDHDKMESECRDVLDEMLKKVTTQSEDDDDDLLLDDGISNKNDIPMSDVSESSNIDVDIREILDSIISQVCEEVYHSSQQGYRDKNENDDVTVVEDTVRGLVDQVCEQLSPSQELLMLKEKSLLRRDFASVEEKDRYINIAEKCLQGFGFCLRRFHEHYKSQYRMAHFLAHSPVLKVIKIYSNE